LIFGRRAAEIGKSWPEVAGTRQRAVLTALIERIDVGAASAISPRTSRKRSSKGVSPAI
jgi:hypothetical protein